MTLSFDRFWSRNKSVCMANRAYICPYWSFPLTAINISANLPIVSNNNLPWRFHLVRQWPQKNHKPNKSRETIGQVQIKQTYLLKLGENTSRRSAQCLVSRSLPCSIDCCFIQQELNNESTMPVRYMFPFGRCHYWKQRLQMKNTDASV